MYLYLKIQEVETVTKSKKKKLKKKKKKVNQQGTSTEGGIEVNTPEGEMVNTARTEELMAQDIEIRVEGEDEEMELTRIQAEVIRR